MMGPLLLVLPAGFLAFLFGIGDKCLNNSSERIGGTVTIGLP